ncbi:hypothetical protein HK097_004200, partial [Rhizophlyctis rosea]
MLNLVNQAEVSKLAEVIAHGSAQPAPVSKQSHQQLPTSVHKPTSNAPRAEIAHTPILISDDIVQPSSHPRRDHVHNQSNAPDAAAQGTYERSGSIGASNAPRIHAESFQNQSSATAAIQAENSTPPVDVHVDLTGRNANTRQSTHTPATSVETQTDFSIVAEPLKAPPNFHAPKTTILPSVPTTAITTDSFPTETTSLPGLTFDETSIENTLASNTLQSILRNLLRVGGDDSRGEIKRKVQKILSKARGGEVSTDREDVSEIQEAVRRSGGDVEGATGREGSGGAKAVDARVDAGGRREGSVGAASNPAEKTSHNATTASS